MRLAFLGVGIASAVFLAVAIGRSAESSVAAPEPEIHVVHIEVSSKDEIDFLSPWVDIWDVDRGRGILEAAVDRRGLDALRDFGFHFEIDDRMTAKYNTPLTLLEGQTEGIPGYPCYRTVEETMAAGAALAAAHPDLAEWIDIGDSWEKTTGGGNPGYDIMVLRLTNTVNGIPSAEKPRLWVMGAIHARELVTAETVTRFAEYLLLDYDLDPDVTWLLDHHELHFLLQANPDGRKKAETGALWRKNTNETYCGATSTSRGADLNRNYDFEWGCCGGSSSNECAEDFRGAFAASEPEAQAVQAWIIANFPDWRVDDLSTPAPNDATGIFIDVHSHGGDVLTAFGFQDPPDPNDAQILRLARKFSYFTGYDARLGSYSTVDGATKDFGYGRMGMPAFTFELGTEFFQDCSVFESTIYPDNVQALLYAARAIRAPYTQSSGPEVVSPAVLPMVAGTGETVVVTAVVDDDRFGPGETSPPASVETIAEAEFYVDIPPWQTGAAPVTMTADDGAYDGVEENVTGSFSTTGLADGRHTVFFRGRDSAGYWGTVRAVFVWVLDPATAAHISGTVSDATTGLPVEATITAGPFATATGPATGSYDLLLPEGLYDVSADADGFGTRNATGIAATAGETTALSFALQPFEAVFEDDVESGNTGWIREGQWAITTEASSSPTHSWTDSPGADSGDDWEYSLTSPSFDLSGFAGVRLEFSHIYALETNYDYGHVDISVDGGVDWTTVASFNGFQTPTWLRESIEIPAFDRAMDARVRFRISTDFITTEDGWHIDDIVIRAFDDRPPGLLFRDGFESGGTTGWSVTNP